MVAQRLAQTLHMPANTLQSQRTQTRLDWGDLVIANRLAQSTGLSFDQIVREGQNGKDWDAVAHAHGLDLSKLITDSKQAQSALQAPQGPGQESSQPGPGRRDGHRRRGSN